MDGRIRLSAGRVWYARWVASCLALAWVCSTGCAAKTAFTPSLTRRNSESSASESSLVPPTISVAKPSIDEPVTLGMLCTTDEESAGGFVDVWIQLRLAEGAFLHAFDAQHPEFEHLAADLKLPAGLEAQGEWEFTEPEVESGHRVFRDGVTMHRRLRRVATTPSQGDSVTAIVGYQACTDAMCWPAMDKELTATILR